MARKRDWSSAEYLSEAREFVACYGDDNCWDEFVYEYCKDFTHNELKRPDGDLLMGAINRALREHSKSQVDGDLTMDDK